MRVGQWCPDIGSSIDMTPIRNALATILTALNGLRAQAAGQRIKFALYDGYVGAYAEFYRQEYSLEPTSRR